MIAAQALLGLNPIEVLLHLLNLAILLVVVRVLLYNPIKKFMKSREETYRAADDAAKKALDEAQESKQKYQQMLDEARQNAVHIAEEANAAAELQSAEIVAEAKDQAKLILDKAAEDIEARRKKSQEDMSYAVSELAIDIAAQILSREVSTQDNDKIIDTVIENWKKS